MSQQPILIWGGGAIGGTIAAYLARAGVPVLIVDIVAEHVEACRTTGLSIRGPVDTFTVRVPAVTPDELTGTYERVILAVKAQASETALAQLLPHLADDGFVLSAQNGLSELTVAAAVGEQRTMGCFVNFGADWHGPGDILFGNRSAVVIGEIDGSIRARTRKMHADLRLFEPDAVLTDNIWGYLWGKVAYVSMLFATSLDTCSMAESFADPDRFVVFDQLGREAIAIAALRGVEPVGFGAFDPKAFLPGAPEVARRDVIAWLADFNSKSAKTHSGIHRDLAVRKRRTEVDPQITTICALGREAGVPTPALSRLVELIKDVEQGRRPLGVETFRELITTCTSASTARPPS